MPSFLTFYREINYAQIILTYLDGSAGLPKCRLKADLMESGIDRSTFPNAKPAQITDQHLASILSTMAFGDSIFFAPAVVQVQVINSLNP